jgi:predicted NBD/HSP70 family sugar kinase
MYVGVDIGGTKTLLAALDEHGEITEETVFPTPKKYDNWLLELRHAAAHLKTKDFKAGGVAAPGRIDRKHGQVIRCSNLPWENAPLQANTEKTFNCPMVVENDANLAGLSEAMLHPDQKIVLYVTVSTGIGTAVIADQKLEPNLLDNEGGQILIGHKNDYITWEKFSAGRILYEHFGKKVSDIAADDSAAWQYIARHIAVGLHSNIVIVQPDLVVIGGSVGSHFEHYGKLLKEELERYKLPVVKIPRIVEAQRPEKAVVYGCYDLARQVYGGDAENN